MGLSLAACGRDSLVDSFGCPGYQLACNGVCTDVSSDDANCGACGTVCDADHECLVAACRQICDDGETLCGDGCVDRQSDAENCGWCDNECAPGAACIDGACSATGCEPGQQRCGDQCVDTSSDPDHCGECFAECARGTSCENNTCVEGCANGQECDGRCVDTETARNHCGECGNRCRGQEVCAYGECSACTGEYSRCGNQCVDLDSDPNHCGDCDNECAPGAACDAGSCGGCSPGLGICDGQCTDFSVDPENCGGCGVECVADCVGGYCCYPPAVVCDDQCVDLQTSTEHCGDCFAGCAPGMQCQQGACYYPQCDGGFSLCGDFCTDLQSDPYNCGGCGNICSFGYQCIGGSCDVACAPPQIPCSGACVNPRNDAANCGACGYECAEGFVCRAGECTQPVEGCDFRSLAYPILLNGGISVADITVDDDCNLYVGMQQPDFSGVVYSINGTTGVVSAITSFATRVRGLAYRSEDGLLYGAALDLLVSVAPDGSYPQTFEESVAGEYLNGMTIAPANWGEHDGYLVVAQSTGNVIVYDPEDPVPEVFVAPGGYLADVEFDGQQLYVASFGSQEILKVTPSGEMSTFTTLPCGPDGLTVEPGVRLFASCGDTGDIYTVDLETGEYAWLATFGLSRGWAPAGLLWQPGVLLVIEETTGLNALFL